MTPDLISGYQDPNLQAMQDQAAQAQTTAAGYQSAASMLPQKLKQAIQEKMNYNKDIISQQNTAQGEYFAAPAVARDKYSNVWDPAKREALAATEQAGKYSTYATLSDILAAREGSVSDILNAGTGAFNAVVQQQQAEAETAQQKFVNALSILDKINNAKQWTYDATHKGTGTPKSILDRIREEDELKFRGYDKYGNPLPTPTTQTSAANPFAGVPGHPLPNMSPGKEGMQSSDGFYIAHNGEWMIKNNSSKNSSQGGVPSTADLARDNGGI